MRKRDRPSLFYRFVVGASKPLMYGLYRLEVDGLENIPATGGFVLSANHVSNFDPWPLGVPIGSKHYLRHMAKSELYWWPHEVRDRRGRRLPGEARRARHEGDGDGASSSRGKAMPW